MVIRTDLIVHLPLWQNWDEDRLEFLAAPAVDKDVDATVDDCEEPADDVHVQLPLRVAVSLSLSSS